MGGPKAGKGRADYTIYNEHKLIMILEAKSLTESLDEPKILKQLLTYCTFHQDKPRWGILTNGRYWHIYDNEASGNPFERCVFKIDVRARDLSRQISQVVCANLGFEICQHDEIVDDANCGPQDRGNDGG